MKPIVSQPPFFITHGDALFIKISSSFYFFVKNVCKKRILPLTKRINYSYQSYQTVEGMKPMLLGVGCDIIEIARIEKAVRQEAFKRRVFAAGEIAYCEGRGRQAAASFAARFAAKEAVLKALGTGLRGGALTEIAVVNDELGKPSVRLAGYHQQLAESLGVKRICLSMSHGRETAMAYVVMED